MPEVPKEFFTLQSMITLGGATAVTLLVANGIQRAFDFNPKWLALLIAEAISLFGVIATNGHGADFAVGFVNGFLIFNTAAGLTGLGGTGGGTRAAVMGPGDSRTFWSPWF